MSILAHLTASNAIMFPSRRAAVDHSGKGNLGKHATINVTGICDFAGIVGPPRVETRVNMTDKCLSGRHVADMSANILATQHKKLSAGVLLISSRHVTC
jgi:hypothetical protein